MTISYAFKLQLIYKQFLVMPEFPIASRSFLYSPSKSGISPRSAMLLALGDSDVLQSISLGL